MSVNCQFCREKKAEDILKSNMNFKKKNKLLIEEYEKATILPARKMPDCSLMWGNGGVIDNAGNYIGLSAYPGRLEGRYPVEKDSYVDERVVYCGYLVNHWGHFLVDVVSRLWYFFERDENVDKYIFTANFEGETEVKNNFLEFFKLLNIYEKIEIINRPVKYKKVIIPEMGYLYRNYYSDQYKSIFDCVAENALKKYNTTHTGKNVMSNKIFFSRSQFPKAKSSEFGLEMLDDYFIKNGYSICFPEKMSLTEMIVAIRNADVCAFESGSAPHNMILAEDGQKTVIVERQSVVNNYQCNIDCIKELNVEYIDGHYTVYPTYAGGGPFFLAYNEYFERYTEAHGNKPPSPYYIGESYLKKQLRGYMRAYYINFGENWGLEEWMLNYREALYEGYVDSNKVLGKYLSGERLYSWKQLTHLITIKMQIKRLLKR